MGAHRSWFQASLVGILGVAVLGSTLALNQRRTDYAFLDPIIDVKQLITQRYAEAPDLEKLQLGAINGMVEALSDPYTQYVPPADTSEFTKQLTGEYVGIGAQVISRDGWLTIVTPLEDSPAFRVGLMADDRVAEIEGKSTHEVPVDRCIDMLTGEPGTPVKILVERKGEKIPFEIVRERIKTRSVKGYHRDPADASRWLHMIDAPRSIAYLRITQFTPRVSVEVASALESVGASRGELKGLVLDLRYNPGGVLGEAVAIADLFLDKGVIVSTRGRAHPEEVANAVGPGTLPAFPIAVLLNGASASASEVLAGALVENGRAVVVGERSFGKGSVQSVHELTRGKGGELKLTEQGYYLPSGRSITRKDDSASWGVDPSEGFFVPMADKEIIAMFEVRRKHEVLSREGAADAGDWTDTEFVLRELKDPQLAAAVRAVQGHADTGAWAPQGAPGATHTAVAGAELDRVRKLRDRLERELIRVDRRLETLETAAADPAASPTDFWPDALDLTGGTLVVRDKAGAVVCSLEITGNNLERWLVDADLKRPEAPPAP